MMLKDKVQKSKFNVQRFIIMITEFYGVIG